MSAVAFATGSRGLCLAWLCVSLDVWHLQRVCWPRASMCLEDWCPCCRRGLQPTWPHFGRPRGRLQEASAPGPVQLLV